jgi:hypothetical protein
MLQELLMKFENILEINTYPFYIIKIWNEFPKL